MPAEPRNLDQVPAAIKEHVRAYSDYVAQQIGPSLLELSLYGRVLEGTFRAPPHRLENVIVVAAVDLDMLRRFGTGGPRFGRLGIAAPVVMTPSYIQASQDSFPLEMLEIGLKHIVLLGEPHFEDLKIADADVRLQCEHELKTILINMLRVVLSTAGDVQALSAVAESVVESLGRTLRGLAWLKGVRTGVPMAELLPPVEAAAGCRLPTIWQLLGENAPADWERFRSLYTEVEALRHAIDSW